jgi:hypothetical protein
VAAWSGGKTPIPGEGDDPYNRVAFRGADHPLDSDFEYWATQLFLPLLGARIDAEKKYPEN